MYWLFEYIYNLFYSGSDSAPVYLSDLSEDDDFLT